CFFFSSRRRHTRFSRDWSSDVCSSDLTLVLLHLWRAAGGDPHQGYVEYMTMAGNVLLGAYTLLLFSHALAKTKSVQVALLSVVASFTQLCAYGLGFMQDFFKRLVLGRG